MYDDYRCGAPELGLTPNIQNDLFKLCYINYDLFQLNFSQDVASSCVVLSVKIWGWEYLLSVGVIGDHWPRSWCCVVLCYGEDSGINGGCAGWGDCKWGWMGGTACKVWWSSSIIQWWYFLALYFIWCLISWRSSMLVFRFDSKLLCISCPKELQNSIIKDLKVLIVYWYILHNSKCHLTQSHSHEICWACLGCWLTFQHLPTFLTFIQNLANISK